MALTPSQLRATLGQIEQNIQANNVRLDGYQTEYLRLRQEQDAVSIPTAAANKNMKAAEKAGDQELAAKYRAEWQAGVAQIQNLIAQQDATQASMRQIGEENNKLRDQLDTGREQLRSGTTDTAGATNVNNNVQTDPAPVDTRPNANDFSVRPIQVPQVQPDGSVKLGTEYIVTNNVRGVDVGAFNTQAEAQAFIVSQSVPAPSPPVQEATPVAEGSTAAPAAAAPTPAPSAIAPAAVPTDGTPAAASTPAATAISPTPVTPQTVNPVAYDDEGNLMPGFELNEDNNPVFVGNGTPPTVFTPTPVPPSQAGVKTGSSAQPATTASADASREAATKAKLAEAQKQATIQDRFNQKTKGDWRVRLRIAPDAQYLYQDPANKLMAPLKVSDGVVFPYTPIINTSYNAKYDPYDLTHSNYRGYFYRGSQVSDIQIQATFTAQDTREAEYVLAVIHFFRSATKMFYGNDQMRGAPPPLVYLRGYGEYQFNDHACVISNFQYNLPNDVDYISIMPNNIGLNLSSRQSQVGSSPVSTISSAIGRLGNLFNVISGKPGVPQGAKPGQRSDLGVVQQTVSGTGQTTYVPTKIDMTITLLPIQTRSQVSKDFSVKDFANGNLLKKGFW